MISHFGTGFTYRLPGETITRGCACGDRSNCFGCETYEKYKQYAPPPATNFDRIHRMNVEELADMLVDIGECDRRCPAKLGGCIFSDSSCRSAWIDWLRSPAEDVV